jgi:hypothetical protein
MVNVADELPAGIVIEVGTGTCAGSELKSATTSPPVAAGTLMLTVPVALAPATTVVGATVSPILSPNELTNPSKLMAPSPVQVSHPGPALDGMPFNSDPLEPDVTSYHTSDLRFWE